MVCGEGEGGALSEERRCQLVSVWGGGGRGPGVRDEDKWRYPLFHFNVELLLWEQLGLAVLGSRL